MATIRVRDWTKERIEEIRERESHSSHDSVIKSLLKDRELAKFVNATEASPGAPTEETDARVEESDTKLDDKKFENLTVFDEMSSADNGVLFLWCPKCGTEVVHLAVENPIRIPHIEMECQRCLTQLDQHALVGIEIGYPIEERLVENTLQEDLKACVVDYWDRKLERAAGNARGDADVDQLVWQFDRYVGEFDWEWPRDVPAVGFEVGTRYRNEATGETIEVLDVVSEKRNAINSYRVRRYDDETDASDVEPEVLGPPTITNLISNRQLAVID